MQLEEFLIVYAMIGGIIPLLTVAFDVLLSLCD
jgi:hypothetical protein